MAKSKSLFPKGYRGQPEFRSEGSSAPQGFDFLDIARTKNGGRVLWRQSLAVHDNSNAVSAAQHLMALVASSQDAIITKTLDGTIRSWNPAAERMFGYSAGEIIGKSILLLIPQDRQQEEEAILAKLRNREQIDHHENVTLVNLPNRNWRRQNVVYLL